MVGTSIVKNIDPKILSKDYDITKSSAYSLEETAKVIETSKANPDVVVLHSLTNNLKTEQPRIKKLVDNTILKWPTTHVMVSMFVCLFVWCLTTHQPLWVISVRRY